MWYDDDEAKRLQEEFGEDFVQRIERNRVWLHQHVAMMMSLQESVIPPVTVLPWNSLMRELQQPAEILRHLERQIPVVVFMGFTSVTHAVKRVNLAYKQIALLNLAFDNLIHPYPPGGEMDQEVSEISAVHALDRIAGESPPQFSYRPTSCLGFTNCVLSGQDETGHKRSRSGGSRSVFIRSNHETQLLTCVDKAFGTGT